MSRNLTDIVEALESIAPLELAEDWDNVGLLIEPAKRRNIQRILLTIDLTEAVLEEAIRLKSQMIVAYHPFIFEPVKFLRQNDVTQRIALVAIENGIAVYSPHTALDGVPGGINDWLTDGLGEGECSCIKPDCTVDPNQECKIVVFVPEDHVDDVRGAMAEAGAGIIGAYSQCSFNIPGSGTFFGDKTTRPTVGRRCKLENVSEIRLEMVCGGSRSKLQEIAQAIRKSHPYQTPAWDIYRMEPKADLFAGQGRNIILNKPTTLSTMIKRIKTHLGLKHVRVATGKGHTLGTKINSVSVCAGAGGSVLKGNLADLYLTGEMRHHDILTATANDISVILTDHTNSERGYLEILKRKLQKSLDGKVNIRISKCDAEPLGVV